ncbi:MAG: excinuclease ABC subunit UvrA, partial [Planctomycetota bacterium]
MASRDFIRIRGASQHNLKSVDVDVPVGALTVITGLSGSGKSSLAFDTLYAEGQRRYVETFSAYARQFLDRCDRPDVEAVEGIPPAVAIERKRPVRGSRSTVGTMSELLDHLKLLWSKVARLICPDCDLEVRSESPGDAASAVDSLPNGTRAILGFELVLDERRKPRDAAEDLRQGGFTRILRGDVVEDLPADGSNLPATGAAFVVADRVVAGRTSRERLVDSFETAFRAGGGRAAVRVPATEEGGAQTLRFSTGLHCASCDRTFRDPTPNLFSFNSPIGACPTCHGFGRASGIDWDLVVPDPARTLEGGAVLPLSMPSARRARSKMLAFCRERGIPTDVPWSAIDAADRRHVLHGDGRWGGVVGFFRRLQKKTYKVHVRVFLARFRGYPPCPDCEGARLAPEGRAWRIAGRSLPEVLALDVMAAERFFRDLSLPEAAGDVANLLVEEIRTRLACLDAVGLGYLALDRQARTLSGGELQRVNLTAAIGTNLVNTLFVLDEPSVGLHARDNDRLVKILHRLCEQGNTVVVVEHDPAILAAADHVIDLGPRAGEHGGEVVAAGTPARIARSRASLTGAYLSGRRRVEAPRRRRRRKEAPAVGVRGARAHNLRGVDLLLRTGELTVLSGVSGSGKSSLAQDVLHLAVARALGRPEGTPGAHDEVVGVEHIEEVVLVDQGAAGRSSRANPATYAGAWDGIRTLFGSVPAARAEGFTASTFSFNVAGGRCERCAGEGLERVEMQFLSDVRVTCPDCGGTRFRPEVREITWEGLTIADVLALTVDRALEVFAARPRIVRALAPLAEVGLGYVRLGQPLGTLSSGEAQRLRLARALSEEARRGARLYVFDEPTTGLHLEDVAVLLRALRRLADAGHAVLVVEHHLDVIAAADRVVDLGPDGGDAGGRIVADGTPARVARGSGHTARYLRAHRAPEQAARRLPRRSKSPVVASDIRIRGAREHNLRDVDLDLPRDRFIAVSGPSGSG